MSKRISVGSKRKEERTEQCRRSSLAKGVRIEPSRYFEFECVHLRARRGIALLGEVKPFRVRGKEKVS